MSAEIKITAETQQAQASLDVLEQRLRKLSSAAADIFKIASPGNQASILKSYGVPTQADLGGHVLQSDAFMRHVAQENMRLMKEGVIGGMRSGMLTDAAMKAGVGRAMGMGPLFQGPPPIPTGMLSERALAAGAARAMAMGPLTPAGPNWQLGGLGIGAAMFSPWIGARMLNQAMGPLIGGGATGGGGGGLAKTIFGMGGMGGFGEWFLLISAIKKVTSVLEHEFVDALKRGSRLYVQSMMLGTRMDTLSRMQKTFAMLGLPPEAAEKLLATGQFMHGTKISAGSLGSTLLGAARGVMSREEMQAIMNMSDEIAIAWKMTLSDARQSAKVAGTIFRTTFLFSQVKTEWQTFWEQLASVASGPIQVLEASFVGLMKIINWSIEQLIANKNKMVGVFPGVGMATLAQELMRLLLPGVGEKVGGAKFPLGQAINRPESAWERMGLIMHGGIGGNDYARQTAENTKRMADAMSGKGQSSPFWNDVMAAPAKLGAAMWGFHLP